MTVRLRFKNFLREKNDLSTTGEETLLSVSEYYGIQPRSMAFSEERQESRADSLEGYRIVAPGDFVMNYMLAWRGAYGVSDHAGIVSPAYSVFEVDQDIVDLRYLHHRSRSKDMQGIFRCNSKGIMESRLRLYPENLLSINIDLPSLEEQSAIANFLDRETMRIDSLIDRKNRFIALLHEKRNAVISDSVTKGLSNEVPMQASEILSIGNVPAHWGINPVGRALRLTKRIVGDRHEQFSLLSLTTRGVIERDVSQNFGKFPESFDTYQQVEPGNFVFCLFDIDETPRTVGLSEKAGMITGAYAVFECTEPAYARYLLNLFLHLDNCKGLKPFYTGLRKTIRPPRFTSIRIPFPPEEEAREIADYIERQCSKIDQLIDRTQRSIELLREHRTALITAAVTGKIDVRTAA